jgi:hypothetical protein
VASYDVEECSGGEDEDSYWITLGFSSERERLDTLHVVCGKELDPYPGFQGLYLERFDQGMSDYDLADSVVVSATSIDFSFNARGIERLGFPERVTFQISDDQVNKRTVVDTLGRMAVTPNGGVIRRS